MSVERLPIIGVMGSGNETGGFTHAATAGALVARLGCHLLTGAGAGAMRAAAKAFTETRERKGLSIGIVPSVDRAGTAPEPGYPNPYIELPIITNLVRKGRADNPDTRNHVNILTSHALIFCKGNSGTESELRITKARGKPALLFMGPDHSIGTIPREDLEQFGTLIEDKGTLEAHLKKLLENA